jgi:hypothetical protein
LERGAACNSSLVEPGMRKDVSPPTLKLRPATDNVSCLTSRALMEPSILEVAHLAPVFEGCVTVPDAKAAPKDSRIRLNDLLITV